MNYPDEILPEGAAEDEQYSQQDVQSDGIDAVPPSEADIAASEIDNLSQADRAAEASFTLNPEKGISKKEPNKEE